jgi:hypothetical protein
MNNRRQARPPNHYGSAAVTPNEPRSENVPDELKGKGAATTELEELRARVAALEAPKVAPPEPRVTTRKVELWPGSGVWVTAQPESVGDRLVRNEFADVDRAAFEADEAVQAIGREVVGDKALRSPLPQPSPQQHQMLDTRIGRPAEGPAYDARAHAQIDRIAAGQARLDRAEALRRELQAQETLNRKAAAVGEDQE